jgi:hypothetical protein
MAGHIPCLSTGAGQKSLLVLFFRKELLSLFFSEKKNQKTFASAGGRRYGTWPVRER